MKLVVQIPCHEEADGLAAVIADIPREVAGFDVVEVLVIDDGSRDDTAKVAERAGADHVVRSPRREGLARTFARGLDAALRVGADVIVNTDGDNQYPASAIPELVAPIASGNADIVVGDRGPRDVVHFSPAKRLLSRFGSWVVGRAAGAVIPDSASGFRAFSRAAALRLIVESEFTYTHETLIQASRRRMAISHVPIRVRETPRKSRLAKSSAMYVTSSAGTILRAYTMYQPLRVFVTIGFVVGLAGTGVGARFLYFFFTDGGNGHVQSLLLSVLLVVIGFGAILLGLLADVIAGNRRLLEEVLWRVRELETSRDVRDRRESVPQSAREPKETIEVGKSARG